MEILSKSTKQTEEIGAGLAEKVLKTGKGTVVALEGELGAGKTTFMKGFARAFGIKDKIKSPTFVLMKSYKIKPIINDLRHTTLYHLDCYRARDEKDLKILELREIIQDPKNIIVIEWAERVSKIIPKRHISVHIDHVDKKTRKIKILYL